MSAQYTVGDGTDGGSNKRFNGRGIVEDEVLEDVGGFRNYNKRPSRVRILEIRLKITEFEFISSFVECFTDP